MEKRTYTRIFFSDSVGGSITYLFVDLRIQHAMRMCRITLSTVTSLPLPHFSTLFHKPKGLRERVAEHKMCVVMFSTTLVWNISHSNKNSARCYNKRTQVFVQSTRYSWQILIKLDFFRQIFEKKKNIKYHENLSSGSRVVQSEKTDMTKLICSRFSQFC